MCFLCLKMDKCLWHSKSEQSTIETLPFLSFSSSGTASPSGSLVRDTNIVVGTFFENVTEIELSLLVS